MQNGLPLPAATAPAAAADGETPSAHRHHHARPRRRPPPRHLPPPPLPPFPRPRRLHLPRLPRRRPLLPAFRRRFRELHPPPLLGLFFDPDGPDIPSFTPRRRRSDPDLAAAVRGADFFLTRLPSADDASPGWEIVGCRGGYLVLVSWEAKSIAAYNPVTRALDLIPFLPHEIADGMQGGLVCHGFHMVSSDEVPGSFRVVCICNDEARVRAAVFSSCTREWRVLPWEEPALAVPAEWLLMGTLVNGSLYLAHAEQAYMLVLDTATLQFSSFDLPERLEGHFYKVGETKDDKPCIVYTTEFDMLVWYFGPAADGTDKWILEKFLRLKEGVLKATGGSQLEHSALKVLDIINGIVYLSTYGIGEDVHVPCWFLTFCLETMKLEKLFRKLNDSHVHPYIMAWPPSLGSEIVNP